MESATSRNRHHSIRNGRQIVIHTWVRGVDSLLFTEDGKWRIRIGHGLGGIKLSWWTWADARAWIKEENRKPRIIR